MAEAVLVDTSAWVAFFRGDPQGRSAVERLLVDGAARRCGPVELELRRGLRRTESARVLKLWTGLPDLPIEAIDFTSAGDLLRDLREGGVTLPSLDALIACLALRHDVAMLAFDRHFDAVPGLRRWDPATV